MVLLTSLLLACGAHRDLGAERTVGFSADSLPVHLGCDHPPAVRADTVVVPTRAIWVRMIEDLRPLSRDAAVPIPSRMVVGSMTSTAGVRKQPRWLASERPLADRIDADLTQLLHDAGFPIPTHPDPRSPPSLLDVQIVELWVTDGAAVDSGGMAAVTLLVTVRNPATGQRLWRHKFSAGETAPPPPHSAAMLEKTLNTAYCRALDAMAGAFRTPEFAAAVAGKPIAPTGRQPP